jgi:hypothetical protein
MQLSRFLRLENSAQPSSTKGYNPISNWLSE